MHFLIDLMQNFTLNFIILSFAFIKSHKDVPFEIQNQFLCLIKSHL